MHVACTLASFLWCGQDALVVEYERMLINLNARRLKECTRNANALRTGRINDSRINNLARRIIMSRARKLIKNARAFRKEADSDAHTVALVIS